ncbi:hypothetical protein [Streptomyces sp. NPDC095602]|uniref:hypothetical protein n=1 Tax=Streptomyces sp. NPDC095602 TaxID=3155819 RepID=UPI00332C83EC
MAGWVAVVLYVVLVVLVAVIITGHVQDGPVRRRARAAAAERAARPRRRTSGADAHRSALAVLRSRLPLDPPAPSGGDDHA